MRNYYKTQASSFSTSTTWQKNQVGFYISCHCLPVWSSRRDLSRSLVQICPSVPIYRSSNSCFKTKLPTKPASNTKMYPTKKALGLRKVAITRGSCNIRNRLIAAINYIRSQNTDFLEACLNIASDLNDSGKTGKLCSARVTISNIFPIRRSGHCKEMIYIEERGEYNLLVEKPDGRREDVQGIYSALWLVTARTAVLVRGTVDWWTLTERIH